MDSHKEGCREYQEIKHILSMNTKRRFHKRNTQHQEGHFTFHILSVNENEFQQKEIEHQDGHFTLLLRKSKICE